MAEYTSGYTGAQIDTHLGTVAGSNLSSTNKITRSATLVVAASDSSAASKEQADYVCDGVADNVQIQAALDALPAGGGEVHLCEGNYTLTASVSRAIDNVTISGVGKSTYLANDGSTYIYMVGTQSGWVFQNFRTDYGGLDIVTGSDWSLKNVWTDNLDGDPVFVDHWSERCIAPKSAGNFLGYAHKHPLVNVFDNFESEGWTADTGTISWETSIVHSGSKSMKVTAPVDTTITVTQYTGPFPDLTNCSVGFWLYVENYENVSSLMVYLRTTDATWSHFTNGYAGSVYTVSGQWVFVPVVAPDTSSTGTPDHTNITAVRIKLVPAAGTSITAYIDDVLYWKRAIVPGGAVTFSFDDGLPSVLQYAKPAMDVYNYRGVQSYVVGRLDSDALADARLYKDAGWDVVNHSYDHRTSAVTLHEPARQYILAQKILGDNGLDSEFALLFGGQHNGEMVELISKHMTFARSSQNGVNSPPGIGNLLYSRYVTQDTPVATVQGWIDDAMTYGTWLVLMFHDIVETKDSTYDFLASDFASVVAYCNTQGVDVVTFSQMKERILMRPVQMSGTGTIPNGSTSVNIRHGFSQAPTSIQITPTSSLGSAASIWVSSKDTGTGNLFTVSCNTDPGADVTFEWVATL